MVNTLVVSDNGKVTCTYGNERGSEDGQLRVPVPRHLAIDKDSQSNFVADYYKGIELCC